MNEIKLTRKERSAIVKILEKHNTYPANTYGFWAGAIGASNAAAARRMEHTGLIFINRIADNCFRYGLTDAGKERARKEAA
jgi:hypothetical protein